MRRALSSLIVILMATGAMCVAADATSPSGVVNVNTATAEQLQLLPRVGPALAQRIIDFRTANGPFAKPEELVAVNGIGERSLELLKPWVVTKGDTSLNVKVRLPRSTQKAE